MVAMLVWMGVDVFTFSNETPTVIFLCLHFPRISSPVFPSFIIPGFT